MTETTEPQCGNCKSFEKGSLQNEGWCMTQNVREGWGPYKYMFVHARECCTNWEDVNDDGEA